MTDNPQNDGTEQQRDTARDSKPTEQRLEEWGRRVGRFFASAAARAREEAEDMWAEAQSIRRGERE